VDGPSLSGKANALARLDRVDEAIDVLQWAVDGSTTQTRFSGTT
jgi:hypothetical protein